MHTTAPYPMFDKAFFYGLVVISNPAMFKPVIQIPQKSILNQGRIFEGQRILG
jgi:hypothetical protein